MVAKFLQVALGLALMSPVAPAVAQSDDGTSIAGQVAKNMQNMVGNKFEGDLVITAIASEANILVITVNGASGWEGYPREQAGASFLAGFCGADGGKAFMTRAALRVDS